MREPVAVIRSHFAAHSVGKTVHSRLYTTTLIFMFKAFGLDFGGALTGIVALACFT
jgi:hypothetical protein